MAFHPEECCKFAASSLETAMQLIHRLMGTPIITSTCDASIGSHGAAHTTVSLCSRTDAAGEGQGLNKESLRWY